VHGEELGVFPSGGVEEEPEVGVDHLVVPHEEGGRGEVRLLGVLLFGSGFGELEALAGRDDVLVRRGPSHRDDGVVRRVVSL
jgi:hypothetical protein